MKNYWGISIVEYAVIDDIDASTQAVIEQCAALLPLADRNITGVDLQWLADRNSTEWTLCFHDDGITRSSSLQQLFKSCLSAFLHSWTIIHTRLTQLFPTVQPVLVQEQRSSLFPGTAPNIRKC